MNDIVLGICSECGGRVIVPRVWRSTVTQKPPRDPL